MKKYLVELSVLLLFLALAGCSAGGQGLVNGEELSGEMTLTVEVSPEPTPVPTPTASPAPTPTPTPEPLKKVLLIGSYIDERIISAFDRPEEWDLSACSPEQFQSERISADIYILFDRGCTSELLPLIRAAAPESSVISVDDGQAAEDERLYYVSGTDAASPWEQVLEAALIYPPHDTPVRMLGVFESEESQAYLCWVQLVGEGKIFDKGVCIHSKEDSSFEEWFHKQLGAFYPGMLDCIFTESAEDAEQVVVEMLTAGRDDFELFTPHLSEGLYGAMEENRYLVGGLYGIKKDAVSEACVSILEGIIMGERPENILLDNGVITLE